MSLQMCGQSCCGCGASVATPGEWGNFIPTDEAFDTSRIGKTEPDGAYLFCHECMVRFTKGETDEEIYKLITQSLKKNRYPSSEEQIGDVANETIPDVVEFRTRRETSLFGRIKKLFN